MKRMNKFALLALVGLAAASCGKKDAASVGELDGDWTLKAEKTELTNKSTRKNGSSLQYSDVSNTTENYSVSGGTITGTATSSYEHQSGSSVTKTDRPNETISGTITSSKVTFSKKDGKYSSTEKGKEVRTSTEVKNYGSGSYSYSVSTTITVTDEYTDTKEGTFALNTKTGDVKKGTKLFATIKNASHTGIKTTETKVTSTTPGSTLSTTVTTTETDTYNQTHTRDVASETMVFNITEATKKSLKLEYVGSYSYTNKGTETSTSNSSGTSITTKQDYFSDNIVTAKSSFEFEK